MFIASGKIMLNVGNRIMNTYLYQIAGGYVMIDTGYEKHFNSCNKKMCKQTLSAKDIKYIFLTHVHDDHVGFINNMIKENKNLKVIMSPKGIETFRKGQNSFEGGCVGRLSYLFCLFMKMLGIGQHTFPPIKKEYEDNLIFISDENKAELEEILNGTIVETPGHTDDSISLLTKDGYLFCGDAAMNGFPSKNNIIIWIGNKEQYTKSWEKIISLNPNKIYPAHGNPFNVVKLKKNIKKLETVRLFPLLP